VKHINTSKLKFIDSVVSIMTVKRRVQPLKIKIKIKIRIKIKIKIKKKE
jgi:hypothetical protein